MASSTVSLILAGVGIVGLFVLIVRAQLTNDRAINGMMRMQKDLMAQHAVVLEHLMISADPDAWREKQVDKFRKERDAERAKQILEPGENLPPKKGIG